jgi:hypothetical protein
MSSTTIVLTGIRAQTELCRNYPDCFHGGMLFNHASATNQVTIGMMRTEKCTFAHGPSELREQTLPKLYAFYRGEDVE